MNVTELLLFIVVAVVVLAACYLVYRRYRRFFTKATLRKIFTSWFGLKTLFLRHRQRRIDRMRLEVEKSRRLMWHKDDYLTRNRADMDSVNQQLHYLKERYGIYDLEDEQNKLIRQGIAGQDELDRAVADLEKNEQKFLRMTKRQPEEEHYEARAIESHVFDSTNRKSYGRNGSHSVRFPIKTSSEHRAIDESNDGPPALI